MTKIEWTNETWNPIIGCSKISPGCDNCYAEKMAYRLSEIERSKMINKGSKPSSMPYNHVIGKKKWTGKTHLVEDALEKPSRWKKPRMIFVCSMGDLFHESIPLEWIDQVMAIIGLSSQHTFQILTKRPERMYEYYQSREFGFIDGGEKEAVLFAKQLKEVQRNAGWFWDYSYDNDGIKDFDLIYEGKLPLPNLWLGVTAENQEQADKRIPLLLQIPATVRFVSCEPLLNNINISPLLGEMPGGQRGLDWVIAGGESGNKARPMHPDWVRSIRDQCKTANVPFFFKQWGKWRPEFKSKLNERTCIVCGCTDFNACEGGCSWIEISNMEDICSNCGHYKVRKFNDNLLAFAIGKKKSGRKLDGIEYNEFPKTN